MPSPFPGMDPFLEGLDWPDFHGEFIHGIRAALVPLLSDRYVARVGRFVFYESEDSIYRRHVQPDLTIAETQAVYTTSRISEPPAKVPDLVALPLLEEQYQRFIEVQMKDSREVVAVVELLSPSNKRPHGEGRQAYLIKRQEILQGPAHLIEIDLLRGGQRMPMAKPFPKGDYYAMVSRVSLRPQAEVWAFTLRDALPTIPIPLSDGDPDVLLELQKVMEQAYDRADYRKTLNYDGALAPPLTPSEAEWLKSLMPTPASPARL